MLVADNEGSKLLSIVILPHKNYRKDLLIWPVL